MIIFLVWVVVLIAVLVLYLRQVYSRFSRHGVKFLRPVPLLGNMGRILFRREHFAYDVLNLYKTFRVKELIKRITVKDFEYFLDHRTLGSDSVFGRSLFFLKGQEWKDMRSTLSPAFTSSKIRLMIPFMIMIIYLVGIVVFLVLVQYLSQIFSRYSRYGVKFDMPLPIMRTWLRFIVRYEFSNSIVMVNDIELVKKITVKDFEHFLDHRSIFSNSDSYFARNLFSMKGQEWKDMRSTLSPAFTSSKIRLMVPFMVEVGDQMIMALKQQLKNSNSNKLEVDVKDMTTRFANDVVATCAFGLKVDSHHDTENSFYVMGKKISTFTFKQILSFFFLMNLPRLARQSTLVQRDMHKLTFAANCVCRKRASEITP
ncbi:unnamed protein product [Chrysodeixis includens]|uniref:unspecific monooxygenase n=1 Tax=Chrysodeixis includens TaxID=689277 RepID=A0A9N8KSD9_CHRIL|nr:unnamed protein product [Chrysodeixis includens]